MKPFIKIVLFCFVGVPAIFIGALFFDDRPITFESFESLGFNGEPEYNEIKFTSEAKKDIWVMRQSQGHPATNKVKWDRLAIVVDKQQKPFRAQFYQLNSGSFEWSESDAKPYRVSCFMCHANGPRAIRELKNSNVFSVSIWQQMRIKLWNLRMARYGRVLGEASVSEKLGTVPFRHLAARDNEPLKLSTCTMCHNDSKGGRGFLTRQNILTAKFLTDEKQMPPGLMKLNEDETKYLRRFSKGF